MSDSAQMRAICEQLGFDPTNHHNAAKCPYCSPPDDQRRKPSHLPANAYNPRPDLDTVIEQLTAECDKTRGHDGSKTTNVRIWVLRRALEYLLESAGTPAEAV